MSVAAHLHIELDEYDARIRSFIPRYEAMLAAAAAALHVLDAEAPVVVDLGIGTGALAHECLKVRPHARLYGVDADTAILDVARRRLGRAAATAGFLLGSFLEVPLPSCDAVVASFALHHVPAADQKRVLYRACRNALRTGGLLVSADCFPATDPALARAQREAWLAHLRRSYSPEQSEDFLAAWAREDVYFPLNDELDMIRSADLRPEVTWRDGAFAVIAARRPLPAPTTEVLS